MKPIGAHKKGLQMWIDPNGNALRYLRDHEQSTKRKKESMMKNDQPQEPPNRKLEFDDRLNKVLALAIATSGFCEIERRRTAAAQREEVLKNAAAIEKAEAERRLNLRARHDEYDKISKYGALFSMISESSLWEMLAKADEWPFLVLQEAKEIQLEEELYEPQS